jgi:DNA invertase Pin-like site-specific DNA recombinase
MGLARRKQPPVGSVLPFLLHQTADLPPEPIVGYVRKSSESEDKQVRSTVQQKQKIIEKFGELSRGLWFEDNGVSGRSFDRPEFQRLLSFCRANKQPLRKPGRIAIYDVSRFGRIVTEENKPDVDAMEYMRLQLKQLGWNLAWVEGPTSENELVNHFLRIMESQASGEYTANLSKKVTNGKADAALNGWWPGGVAPFGASRYNRATRRVLAEHGVHPDTGERINGEHGHQRSVVLVRNDETATALEQLMREFLKGKSLDKLCLIADKITPRRFGGRWSTNAMVDAITNPALIGEMHHRLKGGLRVVKMNWEPIINPSLWHEVKSEYDRRRTNRSSESYRDYAIDCLFCARCGAPYWGETTKSKSGGKVQKEREITHSYYRHVCARRSLTPETYDLMLKSGCVSKRLPVDLVETALCGLLIQQRTGRDYLKHLKAIHSQMMEAVENGQDELRRAEGEVLKLKRKQATLLDLAADQEDKATASSLMEKYNTLKATIQEAEFEVERKQIAAGSTKEMWKALEGCMSETEDVLEAWETLGIEARAAVIRWWVLSIDVLLPEDAPKFNCPVVMTVYLRTLPEIPQTVVLQTGGGGNDPLIGFERTPLETSSLKTNLLPSVECFEVAFSTLEHGVTFRWQKGQAPKKYTDEQRREKATQKRDRDLKRMRHRYHTEPRYRARSARNGKNRRARLRRESEALT